MQAKYNVRNKENGLQLMSMRKSSMQSDGGVEKPLGQEGFWFIQRYWWIFQWAAGIIGTVSGVCDHFINNTITFLNIICDGE